MFKDMLSSLSATLAAAALYNGYSVAAEDIDSISPEWVGAKICCSQLAGVLGGNVFYQNQSQYTSSLSSYYSGQESDLFPTCIVQPTSALQVSKVVKILSAAHRSSPGSCLFAVRGGGHTSYAGAANIQAGITIDLRSLKDITVNAEGNRITTSIGAGASWGDVYEKLDKMGLSIVGGRANTVGVAGLTTGGGISYFSGRYGLVCDNVENYEVVLSDGRIVNANSAENVDLRNALRGGSNNFGIVTRFDVATFEQGQLWGGEILYDFSTLPSQLQAFYDFGINPNYDEYSALYQVFAARGGLYFILDNLVYTKATPYPATFDTFYQVQPQLYSNLKTAPLSNIVTNVTSVDDINRHMYITTSFSNNLKFLQWLLPTWETFTLSPSLSTVRNLENVMLNQHLVPSVLKKSSLRGGNSLGLNPSKPLVISMLSVTWSDAKDDVAVTTAAQAFMGQVEKEAKKRGVHNPFLYLNYANGGQDVINRYGEANREKMRRVSKKLDPWGVFQKAVPGGFKLWP